MILISIWKEMEDRLNLCPFVPYLKALGKDHFNAN